MTENNKLYRNQAVIGSKYLSGNNLPRDHFDPWQVVPRLIFTRYSRLLISTAFVVVSRVGCLRVTVVRKGFVVQNMERAACCLPRPAHHLFFFQAVWV